MIPLNLKDETVLRRTLQEISDSIPRLSEITPVDKVDTPATNEMIVVGLNKAIDAINALIADLPQSSDLK